MANYPVGTHFSGPIKLGVQSMPLNGDVGGIDAAVTLTADESNGQHYILDAAEGLAVLLPVPTQGWSCKFTVGGAFGTTAWVFRLEQQTAFKVALSKRVLCRT